MYGVHVNTTYFRSKKNRIVREERDSTCPDSSYPLGSDYP